MFEGNIEIFMLITKSEPKNRIYPKLPSKLTEKKQSPTEEALSRKDLRCIARNVDAKCTQSHPRLTEDK